jgi:hypothetical protein
VSAGNLLLLVHVLLMSLVLPLAAVDNTGRAAVHGRAAVDAKARL